ncbi:restriction endonuclease [Neobacillus sp. YX16]|uniref:restriction endonuclease n=1 Tax=Neobacillus sp. YX16 TaxID=3047874 RepID=UPI0024C2E147|nr:restriction endonuclease [Neobacillus sp. YX16]WHZ04948.1 restriction endonuclease [Neobacillus sp. YX16]
MVYYYRNRSIKKKTTNKNIEPKRIIKMNCPLHGELVADTSWNKFILYESLNKETQRIETKCYRCLDERITKSRNEIINKELLENKGVTCTDLSNKAYIYDWVTAIFLVISSFGSFLIWAFQNGMLALLNVGIFGIITILLNWRKRFLEKKSMEMSRASKVHTIRDAKSIIREEAFAVATWRKKQEKIKKEKVNYSFAEIDKMPGVQFENFIKNLLNKNGYENPQITKASGDEGVDIIAYKNGKKIAIQCKRYSGKISNSAIQQVYAGKAFYECQEAYVITNSYFTENAITLAKKLKVKLINREGLFDLMQNITNKQNENISEYQIKLF